VNPWAAIAQAFVYPVARAWADAWFDARRQSELYLEETPNETDEQRAARFRAAVGRVRNGTDDTGPENPPSDIQAHNSNDSSATLRRKDG
jgi:hypothetical protein